MIIISEHEKYIINLKNDYNDYNNNLLSLSNLDSNTIENIIEILSYTRSLKFQEEPDYNYIINKLHYD